MNHVNNLKDRITSKKNKQTELTGIMEMARSFGCIGEVIGREFEVRSPRGELIYEIKQKPMAIKQLNTLLKELDVLLRLDAEREAAKWGKKK